MLGQCLFCLLPGKDFKYYVFVAFTCLTCIHDFIVVDERGKLQSEQGGFVTFPEFDQGELGLLRNLLVIWYHMSMSCCHCHESHSINEMDA